MSKSITYMNSLNDYRNCMTNYELLNILEKLIDTLEYHTICNTTPEEDNETLEYCKQVRKRLFTDQCELTFNVEN